MVVVFHDSDHLLLEFLDELNLFKSCLYIFVVVILLEAFQTHFGKVYEGKTTFISNEF